LRERGIPVMAYSPLGQGSLLSNRKLRMLAAEMDTTPAALAIAWLLRQGDMIVIPQSSDPAHLQANRAAVGLELDKVTLTRLEAIFPPPDAPTPLAMI
jgi:diketogulonate reductase-like aldo/keto reductase